MNITELEHLWYDAENASVEAVLHKCMDFCDDIGSGKVNEYSQEEVAGMLWHLLDNQLKELEG